MPLCCVAVSAVTKWNYVGPNRFLLPPAAAGLMGFTNRVIVTLAGG